MRASWFLGLWCAGCGSPVVLTPDTDDTDADTSLETDIQPPDTDTDLPGTDADGDGWTVEEGDCDDTTIWANPAWDEQPNDDIDNDCDGRIDEVFAGVLGLNVSTDDGTARLERVDSLGDLEDTIVFPDNIGGGALAVDLEGTGWVVADSSVPGLLALDAEGGLSAIWVDETEYAEGEGPLGFFGAIAHPDGYYLVTGADRLWRVETTGEASIVAQWDCLEAADGATELCPLDLALSRAGEIGMFGYFGGFGTWTEEDGLILHTPDIIEDGTHMWYATERRGDDWVALGADLNSQLIARWDPEAEGFDTIGLWTNDDYSPADFAVEEETGDFYISANGAWFTTIWRMTADGTYMAPFFPESGELVYDPEDPPEENRAMLGVRVLYSDDATIAQ